MNTYQYHNYLIFTKKERFHIEQVFKDLIQKIQLYEQQYRITLDLYKSEWDKELLALNATYNILEGERKEIYDKTYNSEKYEDEGFQHDYANHMSGLDLLRHEKQEEKDNIKQKYQDFFDSYSKSILIVLYSLIESKLKKICDVLAIDFNTKLKYEHLSSRNYLQTSFDYFELVIQIPIDSLKPYKSILENIQFIRNRIVHSESKCSKEHYDNVKKNNKFIELEEYETTTILKIKKAEYILSFAEEIRDFFEEIIWLIDSKQDNKILKKGLKYWFGMLDEKIIIQEIEIKEYGNWKKRIKANISTTKDSFPSFQCNISIARSSKNSFEITDQINNQLINDFSAFISQTNSFIFNDVFALFNLSKKGLKIKVMISEK